MSSWEASILMEHLSPSLTYEFEDHFEFYIWSWGWSDYLSLNVALCFRLLCVRWYVVFLHRLCFGFILSVIFLLVCASVCLTCRLFCTISKISWMCNGWISFEEILWQIIITTWIIYSINSLKCSSMVYLMILVRYW